MNRRRSYSAFVRRARFSQGVVNRYMAIARLEVASRPIHDAMSLLDWGDIRRVPGPRLLCCRHCFGPNLTRSISGRLTGTISLVPILRVTPPSRLPFNTSSGIFP